ncbi:hypothetical protein D3C81_1476680 [compost metagenome]
MHVHRTAQMRQDHFTQGALGGGEFRRGFGPGNAKAQLAAVGGGNVRTHDVVGVVHGTVGLVVDRIGPLGFGHQVFDGEHLVHRRVAEGGDSLWVGPVTHLPLAFDVTNDNHQAQVRLLWHSQDQGDVIGLVQAAHVAQGLGHQLVVQRAVIELADERVIFRQLHTHFCQRFKPQGGISHRPSPRGAQTRPCPLLLL